MTQEDKDLLLKDLCPRLPYGLKIYLEYFPKATLAGVVDGDIILHCDKYDYTYESPWDIKYIKPYLLPLSSMTDEQIYQSPFGYATMDTIRQDDSWSTITIGCREYDDIIDWLNKNHFDYRGLIEKGLAIDATGLNIY